MLGGRSAAFRLRQKRGQRAKENKLKRKLFQLICRLLKVQEGTMAPEWLTWLFFPMLKYAINFARVRFDFCSQVYTIQGVKISESLFREWGQKGIPEGSYFKLLRREKDGMIYVERFAPNNQFDLTQDKPSQVN